MPNVGSYNYKLHFFLSYFSMTLLSCVSLELLLKWGKIPFIERSTLYTWWLVYIFKFRSEKKGPTVRKRSVDQRPGSQAHMETEPSGGI